MSKLDEKLDSIASQVAKLKLNQAKIETEAYNRGRIEMVEHFKAHIEDEVRDWTSPSELTRWIDWILDKLPNNKKGE